MSEFKENTSFVLDKIDSLYQSHLPMLEKVSEEMIRYHALSMIFDYLTGCLFLTVLLVVFVYGSKKVKEYDLNGNDGKQFLSVMVTGIIGVVAFVQLVCLFIISLDFFQAIISPEIYTIMKILGK